MSAPSFSAPRKVLKTCAEGTITSPLVPPALPTIPMPMKKREKRQKDPSAPKKPLSSFFLFSKDERPRVLAELGNISVGEQGKELGRRWTALDQQKREPYEAQVREDKQRYLEEMKTYQPSQEFLDRKAELAASVTPNKSVDSSMEAYFTHLLSSWRVVSVARPDLTGREIQDLIGETWFSKQSSTSSQKVKKVKHPMEPKKPKNPFQLFASRERSQVLKSNPSQTYKEVSEVLVENWNTLDEDGKRPYVEEAERIRARDEDKVLDHKMGLVSEDI